MYLAARNILLGQLIIQVTFFLAASLQPQRQLRDGWADAAFSCWRARHDEGEYFMRATYWTIMASLLVVFQTGSTNQVLPLIPLFESFARLDPMPRGRLLVVAIVPALVILPWLLFLATRSGNAESAILFLPLPLLVLLALIGIEVHDWQTARCAVTPSSGKDR